VRIDVTQQDIAMGEPKKCGRCPIALAIKRVVSGPVLVFDESVWANGGQADLPTTAKDFVTAFDFGNPVHPFSFDLDIPEGGV
jgi:hypothetical protein